jgi:3-oxoadipate enol-lactonase
MVAQELAIRHKAYVKKLVLACTSSGGKGGASYPLHTLAELNAEDRLGKIISLVDTRNDKKWQEENPEKYDLMKSQRANRSKIGENEPGRKVGARRQLEARINHDTYERFPNIVAPTYICGGKYDALAPPINLKNLHNQIPNSKLMFYEGGHLFLIQDPTAYQDIIKFFLNEL